MIKSAKHRNNFNHTAQIGVEQFPIYDSLSARTFLNYLISQIRPHKNHPFAVDNMRLLISHLQSNPTLRSKLQEAVIKAFERVHFSTFFTESGMPIGRDFWPELTRRIRHKILPPLTQKDTFSAILNQFFPKKNDYLWVKEVGPELWTELFNTTGWHISPQQLTQLLPAIREAGLNLSFRLTNLSLDKEIHHSLPQTSHQDNPFIQQNYLIQQFFRQVELGLSSQDIESLAQHIRHLLTQGENQLDHVKEQHAISGTSLTQNYFILMMEVIIQRLHLLLDLSDGNDIFDTCKFSDLWIIAIVNEQRKNSLREFISQSVGYVAFQIAEVKGYKGQKYITTTAKSYRRMWLSAMAGGFIISFIALFKNILATLSLAPMWQGFWYSVNYATGFVAIEDTGSTLATKQPAFTASALAKSLGGNDQHEPNLIQLVKMVVDILRSQFASFGGNLLIVFPGSFVLAWLYHLSTGKYLLTGDYALKTLTAQHPVFSLALLYACFTGVFLFLSSILSGYIHNKIRYSHWHERVYQSYIVRTFLPASIATKLRHYILNYGGTFIGNVALGFFLGMAGTLGYIFGLPFDIRHITIASGNVAIALYGLPLAELEPIFLASVLFGVLLIGFFNFLISFALAFYVALKSRGINLSQFPQIVLLLWREFISNPSIFLWPSAQKRN